MRLVARASGASWAGFLLAAGLLVSCAPKPPRAEPVAAAGVLPVTSKTPGRQALRKVSAEQPPPVEAKATETPSAPAAPTKAQKIAQLVHTGRLVSQTRDTLVFARLHPISENRASLYEDAITLGKLRRKLKGVPDLPPAVPVSATVQDSRACLKFDDDVPLTLLAAAIDAALATPGIATAQACLAGALRL